MKVKDKVVVLTGAGAGIGRATAILFAKEGGKLVISDVNEEGLKETVEMITEGKDRVTTKCDVSKSDDVKKMIDLTINIPINEVKSYNLFIWKPPSILMISPVEKLNFPLLSNTTALAESSGRPHLLIGVKPSEIN